MNDQQMLKRLLELGLEKLIEQSGQTLEDFVAGQDVKEAPHQEAVQKVDAQAQEDSEWERRFGK